MPETRDAKCKGCGKVVGKIAFEEEKTEEEWASALSGYLCGDCPNESTKEEIIE